MKGHCDRSIVQFFTACSPSNIRRPVYRQLQVQLCRVNTGRRSKRAAEITSSTASPEDALGVMWSASKLAVCTRTTLPETSWLVPGGWKRLPPRKPLRPAARIIQSHCCTDTLFQSTQHRLLRFFWDQLGMGVGCLSLCSTAIWCHHAMVCRLQVIDSHRGSYA
jgi:hypothetical protein